MYLLKALLQAHIKVNKNMMTREGREVLKHEIEAMNKLDLTSIDEIIEFVQNEV